MSDAVSIDPRPHYRLTFDQVLAMVNAGALSDKARVELLDGKLIEMAPETAPHFRFRNRLAHWLARQLPSETYELANDATLKLSDYDAPEPDIYIWLTADGEYPPPSAVLLAIEVSVTSLRVDLVRKARLYAQYGIAEYWVLDVESQILWVHRDPGDGVYLDIRKYDRDEPVTPIALPQISFSISQLVY